MCRPPQLVRITLLAYLGLVLQPCVMAMGHAPDEHHDNCHQDSSLLDAETCLSQPALDCASDNPIVDSRDSWHESADAQLVGLIPVVSENPPGANAAEFRYFSRAPPPGGPALNICHCVFLK